jgi:hypothetical protein
MKKVFHLLAAATFVAVLAGCNTSAETPKTSPSSSTVAMPTAVTFSLIKYPEQARVFVLVSEDGYRQFAQATDRTLPTEKDPVGMSMSRKEAVIVLGDKTTDLDGKLTVDQTVKAKYWLTTEGRVSALLQSLR